MTRQSVGTKEFQLLDEKQRTVGLTATEKERWTQLRDYLLSSTSLKPGFDVNAAAAELKASLEPAGLQQPADPPTPFQPEDDLLAGLTDTSHQVSSNEPFDSDPVLAGRTGIPEEVSLQDVSTIDSQPDAWGMTVADDSIVQETDIEPLTEDPGSQIWEADPQRWDPNVPSPEGSTRPWTMGAQTESGEQPEAASDGSPGAPPPVADLTHHPLSEVALEPNGLPSEDVSLENDRELSEVTLTDLPPEQILDTAELMEIQEPSVNTSPPVSVADETGGVPPRGFIAGLHRVVVHTVEGQAKRGTLSDVDLDGEEITLTPSSADGTETILTSTIRVIFFMLSPGETPPAPGGRKVRVTFQDGRQVAGFSETFTPKPEGLGFFVVPADTRTNTARIWIYRDAIRQLSVA